jgi:hypothetical protein
LTTLSLNINQHFRFIQLENYKYCGYKPDRPI